MSCWTWPRWTTGRCSSAFASANSMQSSAFAPCFRQNLRPSNSGSSPLLLALSSAHPLATQVRIGWNDVRSVPLLVRNCSGSNAYHDLQARLVGPGADFRLFGAGTFNLINLVAIGEGAMFAMEYHREIAVDGVVLRQIDEPDATISVALGWLPEVEDPVTGSFVAFIRDFAPTLGPQPHDGASQIPCPPP